MRPEDLKNLLRSESETVEWKRSFLTAAQGERTNGCPKRRLFVCS